MGVSCRIMNHIPEGAERSKHRRALLHPIAHKMSTKRHGPTQRNSRPTLPAVNSLENSTLFQVNDWCFTE